MNKKLQLSKSIVLLLIITTGIFSACKKDSLKSKELLIFIKGDYGSVENRVVAAFVHNPAAVTGKTNIKIAAGATREVPADIDVTFAPDITLIDQFNQKNGTTAIALPEANYRIVNSVKHKIVTGALASDSMEIEILNPQALTNPSGYLLPMKISGIDTKDKGAVISTNQSVVYLNVTYEFNNVKAGQAPQAGTLAARTAWSVTVSNTTSGALGPAMLDGNNSTAWRSSNTASALKQVILNMGSQQTVPAFQMVPNYVTTTENSTQITVYSSNDNTNWTLQGIWKGTGPASTSSAASPDIKGVNFVAPVTAQYFRFDITAWVSGNRVGIGELNAVQ
jgi:hypothetical protein